MLFGFVLKTHKWDFLFATVIRCRYDIWRNNGKEEVREEGESLKIRLQSKEKKEKEKEEKVLKKQHYEENIKKKE